MVTVEEYLKKKGIEVIFNGGYYYNCKYKGNKVGIVSNDGINNTYTLYINDEAIMTRALIRTCVGKILNLKEMN